MTIPMVCSCIELLAVVLAGVKWFCGAGVMRLVCVWHPLKKLFSLFLLLFMSFTTLFSIIHGFCCTISTNFYLYLQYFQQKNFSFNKISGS